MNRKRIGLFGGTFDPPHLGHLILANEACHQLKLDQLLWTLTPIPPHKRRRTITPLEHRLAMLELAVADNPSFELSRLELEQPGPHYTLNTVRLLARQQPAADVILLLGGDSLHDLPAWHQPSELVAAVRQIGVMRRPADSLDLTALEEKLPGVKTKVRFVDAPLLEISSREIRRRASTGKPFRYYLLPGVYEYIVEHKLYQNRRR